MTTYTTISNASVAVGGIPSSATVTALRDNPIAISEASSGAPVMVSGWHPVDKATIGDGKDGKIYDFAISGTVSSVVTPDFEDGYEYRIVAMDLVSNSTASERLDLEGYFQTSAVYRGLRYSSANAGITQRYGLDVEIALPRVAKRAHLANGFVYRETDIRIDGIYTSAYHTPAQKLLRARLIFATGSIAGGQVFLMRRREYVSSP